MASFLKTSLLTLTSLALASPALADGAATFHAKCGMCHVTAAGAKPTIGPNLHGVIGRKAGSEAVFASRYSPAMRAFHKTWTVGLLAQYANDPAKTVPGNHMPFAGLHDAASAKAVASWLATQR